MNALKNKIVLITDGTSGMGAATAKRFHPEGELFASDESKFTTGTELRLDGGLSLV